MPTMKNKPHGNEKNSHAQKGSKPMSEQIHIRVTPKMKRLIQIDADRAGQSLSSYILSKL